MLVQFKGSINMILRSSVYRAEIDQDTTKTSEHYKVWYNDDGTFRLEVWNNNYSDCWSVHLNQWIEVQKYLPPNLLRRDDWRFYGYYPY